VLLAPAVLCEAEQSLPFLPMRFTLICPTVGTGSVQCQVANLVRVAGRVLYGHGPPLRRAEKSASVDTQGGDQGFQVAYRRFEGQVRSVPVR